MVALTLRPPWAALVLWAAWLLPCAQAGWELGAQGVSCTTVCSDAGGLTCSATGNQQLNSNFEFDYVFAELVTAGQIPAEYATCDSYQNLEEWLDAQPGTYFVDPNTLYVPPVCFQYSAASTCAGTNTAMRRICCCLSSPGADLSSECFVPTTTTSTATTETTTSITSITSSTTQTSTITTETTLTTSSTTSITATTTVVTTSATTTATSVTETTTSTSVTTLTATTSSTSMTTSSTTVTTETTLTGTSTSVTTTLTTQTSVTSSSVTTTSTSVTQSATSTSYTSTTTTVTSGAVTLISENVLAGENRIPVSDRTGFSEGDMIKIKRDVVKIENITEVGVRRLEGGRRLATVAYLEVTPPISQDYVAGDSISNLGPAENYVGSDPITFHGGQKYKFWLPNHQEFMLLETNEVKVFGTVFPGVKPDQQWFGNFRVVLSDQAPVVEVNVKRPTSNQTSGTRCASRRMESMDVFLGRSKSALREVQRRPMEFTAGESVRFAIDCRKQDRPLLASAKTEYIHVETPSIVFLIVAAHAGNEFPDDPRLQLKYMHLDLLILEMPRKHEFGGILPEIWDIKPRSPLVTAMLQPPEPVQVCEAKMPNCDASARRS
ncbi:unnamed protein product [Durusdinium trenchii]|uniref:Uncharacterized protein n=1 Tax=Durusdinium trenchii TaxID=1381693 RepID=A0ABP0HE68_9DINO